MPDSEVLAAFLLAAAVFAYMPGLLADRLAATLKCSRGVERAARRLGGGILVALGLNLALGRS